MKRLLKLIVLSIVLFSFSNTYAQYKRIGLKAGMNISKLRISNQNDETRELSPSNVYGANAGFVFQSSKNNYFVTTFQMLYSGQGTKVDDYELRFHYIKMPLVFDFRIPIAGPVFMKAGFGPYAAFSFLGKEKYDGLTNEDIFSMARKYEGGVFEAKKDSDVKPYNPLDFGITFGGDVEVNLPNKTSLNLRFDYEIGMWKVTNDQRPDENAEATNIGLKNNTMTISLSYLFDISKDKVSGPAKMPEPVK